MSEPVPSPQAAAYLRALPARGPMWEREVAVLRAEMREDARRFAGAAEQVADVREVSAGGVPARLYRPADEEGGVFVWLHGGAWMIGDPGCYDAMLTAVANRARCAVLSVDYRLAPEHRYPAATDDAWAATRWAARRFGTAAVGGDSSGGNLAAAVALRARDAGLPLALQVLVYAVLDADMDAPYRDGFVERYATFFGAPDFATLSLESLRYIWRTFVPDMTARATADASPMRAGSLAGVAPALILTAEHDLLRLENELYAERLERDGVDVRLHDYAGQVHGFINLLEALPDARDAACRIGDALNGAISVRE
ncbi:alpha/beta hydrolase [Actinomadura viridis]|uniref:Acetyl esterase n=1 Tax=Actinomadura viridis TaxID=58110 RepID=A0A931DKQ2_9ACTN|nr:alpha/beta hydrolase fold domain-containing protein [Actinomadura viridis]MBG6088830.1 acetyl esterase [Actinomadura viridis]